MSVTIEIPRFLQQYSGGSACIAVHSTTVRAALDEVKNEFPSLYQCICDETNGLRRHINIFVNNDVLRERIKLERKVKSGDVISIFQAVSGG